MIWLFGSYARGDYIQDRRVDERGVVSHYQSDIDLMVVINGKLTGSENRKLSNLMHDLQSQSFLTAPLHCLHDNSLRFDSALKRGEYFYQDVVSEGIVLLDNNYPLPQPHKLTYAQRREMSSRYFERFFDKALQFQETCELHYIRGNHALVMYHLHQITEHLFSTYLATVTLYKPRTHRLFEMLLEAKKLDRHIMNIFPHEDEQDRKDYAYLGDAYIDARYKENYQVDPERMDKILRWIERFQHWVYAQCLETLDNFVPEENYSSGFTLRYPLFDLAALKVKEVPEKVIARQKTELKEKDIELEHALLNAERERKEKERLLKLLKDAGLQ